MRFKTSIINDNCFLVGIEPAEASFFDPYQHFVPGLNNATDPNSQRYKICEKEPPAMEKVSTD